MSNKIGYLHSHSGLERTLDDKDIKSKQYVLVDVKYKDVFPAEVRKTFKYEKKTYYKVPTLMFFEKGGVFKNLNA